jgi:hypothetical protein
MKKFILFMVWVMVAPLLAGFAAPVAAAGLESLVGRWQRPDGGYVLEVRKIAADGKATVRYLNPRPIHVARAEAVPRGDSAKVFVELQDTGYPGSTYTLVYEPKKDILLGIYYHAGMGQYFDVIFVRMR